MKRLLLMMLFVVMFSSCVRRELTYSYDPTVQVVLKTDWSALSETPNGMSVYCYADTGEAPIIKSTNNIDSIVLSLPAGNYNLLVFNEDVTAFSSIVFTGMDSYETAEVYAASTTSKWYVSKADDSLVSNPADLAVSTYHDVEIPQEAIDEILGLRAKDEYVETEPYIYIYMTPKNVVKNTKITVKVDGYHNLLSTRATIYGMATGFHFSSQSSHSTYATHLLESWTQTAYTDPTQGEVSIIFPCFGLPETLTNTRFDISTWGGMLNLDALLVDNSTIMSFGFELAERTSTSEGYYDDDSSDGTKSDDDSDVDADVDVDVDVDVDIDIALGFSLDDGDNGITLPDVEPEGSSGSGGFTASVDDWGDEQDIPMGI